MSEDEDGVSTANLPKQGKLPPLDLTLANGADGGKEVLNGHKSDKPRRRKLRNKNLDIVSSDTASVNGYDSSASEPERQRRKRAKQKAKRAEQSNDTDISSEAYDVMNGATNGGYNGDTDVEAATPPEKRQIEVAVTIENLPDQPKSEHSFSRHKSVPSNLASTGEGKLGLSPRFPRATSSASLRVNETDATSDDHVDSIEIPNSPVSPTNDYLSSSYGSNHSEAITSLFQAGSRPTSANSRSSSKPCVRIDNDITVATYSPNASADAGAAITHQKANARPNSAQKRPHSAKHKHKHSEELERPTSSITTVREGVSSILNAIDDGDTVVVANGHYKLKQTTQRSVNPHTKSSIATMIFCGIFVGAVALYFSVKSRSALKNGKLLIKLHHHMPMN